MRKDKYDYLGISLLFSAFLLTVVFLLTCIKKKNFLAALAAVAAIDAVGGWWLIKHQKKKNGGYLFDFFDENSYEVYDDDEVIKAGYAVNAALHKCREIDAECKNAVPLYEIPIDDESTEEDFV